MDKMNDHSSSKSSKESESKRPTMRSKFSETSGESESEGIHGSSSQRYEGLKANRNRMYLVYKSPKRESNSTQSSSLSSSSSGHSDFVS